MRNDMGNQGLEFAAAVNWSDIIHALNYGKRNLDSVTYKKVVKNFKTMIWHILLWIFIAFVIGGGLAAIGHYVSDAKQQSLLEANKATHWVSSVRVNATTVQYTRGEAYRFDVSTLGINLDSDFPKQRSLMLLLDDSNQLTAVVSTKEFNQITNISVIGMVAGFISAIAILIAYAIYLRKQSPYGKQWYAFMQWVNTGDEAFLNRIKAEE